MKRRTLHNIVGICLATTALTLVWVSEAAAYTIYSNVECGSPCSTNALANKANSLAQFYGGSHHTQRVLLWEDDYFLSVVYVTREYDPESRTYFTTTEVKKSLRILDYTTSTNLSTEQSLEREFQRLRDLYDLAYRRIENRFVDDVPQLVPHLLMRIAYTTSADPIPTGDQISGAGLFNVGDLMKSQIGSSLMGQIASQLQVIGGQLSDSSRSFHDESSKAGMQLRRGKADFNLEIGQTSGNANETGSVLNILVNTNWTVRLLLRDGSTLFLRWNDDLEQFALLDARDVDGNRLPFDADGNYDVSLIPDPIRILSNGTNLSSAEDVWRRIANIRYLESILRLIEECNQAEHCNVPTEEEG